MMVGGVPQRKWPDDFIGKVICADCMDILPLIPDGAVDAVVTDPPYPNNAGHFIEGIESAGSMMTLFKCNHWFVFWDEMSIPPMEMPLVAKHIWHRTNTNRPDNYEMIYEFNQDGKKRASRVIPAAVIAVGLTGCFEATGHPTQKNVKLMRKLIEMGTAENDLILDPFAGSGTTLVAAKQLNRRYIGIEISPEYCKIAEDRLRQGELFNQ